MKGMKLPHDERDSRKDNSLSRRTNTQLEKCEQRRDVLHILEESTRVIAAPQCQRHFQELSSNGTPPKNVLALSPPSGRKSLHSTAWVDHLKPYC